MGYANGCMDEWIPECMNGRDGMGWIGTDGWLNHQKQKPRMVGSVQWQASKTHAIWAWAKKRTEKDRKRQKKNKALNHPSSDERERERERDNVDEILAA